MQKFFIFQKSRMAIMIFLLLVFSKNQAFADWQITASQEIQGGPIPLTNVVVTKIETNMARMDIGSNLSVITLPDESGQVQLFHQNKTYRWIPINPATNSSQLEPQPLFCGETQFDGFQARLFCWTNGPEHGRIWVVPAEKFFKTEKKIIPGNQQSTLSENLSVGSMFDKNFIVAGTERSTINLVPLPSALGANDAQTAFTNMVITLTSDLISITQTNFASSEFDIPNDYKNADTQPTQQFQVDPAAFGRGPVGGGNLAGLRQGFEKGQPVLLPPPYSR